jgi:hypothetical protein
LRSHGVVAPYTGGEILFRDGLTRLAVNDRYADGARINVRQAEDGPAAGPDEADLLFLVRADGHLAAVTQAGAPPPQAGDTMVSLGPVPVAQAADGRARL